MKKNKQKWGEGASDFIEVDATPRIKKPKKEFDTVGIILIGSLMVVIVMVIITGYRYFHYFDGMQIEETQSTIQTSEHTMIQINGKDAIMWENLDGTKSARVQYEKCEDVAVVGGIVEHCDRRVINVSWE